MIITQILPGFLAIFGLVFALYGGYYLVVALFGLKQNKPLPEKGPKTRFALLVAARNEQAVIGQLCDSLAAQNYPPQLYEVIVAPNNCAEEDNTEGVARRHGARVFSPVGPVASKGEVLHQMVDAVLEEGRFDAICVFDADNLVHPDFLLRMNDACQAGAGAAQAFRDSKNPADSPVATASSAWYWMLSRFYNGGRERLGLSSLISGSGFMVSCALLRKMGGWHTQTMTEDYEFTAQCLLAGQRVQYVPQAVIYDEQPLRFGTTWRQRRRWSTGGVQAAARYLRPLATQGLRRRSCALLDLCLTFLMPYLQLPSMLLGAVSLGYTAVRLMGDGLLGSAAVLGALLLCGLGALCALSLLAALFMKLSCGRLLPGTLSGLVFFPLYALSWTPITVLSLFRRQKTWDPIAHTRAVGMGQMRRAA